MLSAQNIILKVNHLKLIRKMNLNKLVVAHLNINSIRESFEAILQNISAEVDLLMISVTKIDESFPKSQILLKGFSGPFRIVRNVHCGGRYFIAY